MRASYVLPSSAIFFCKATATASRGIICTVQVLTCEDFYVMLFSARAMLRNVRSFRGLMALMLVPFDSKCMNCPSMMSLSLSLSLSISLSLCLSVSVSLSLSLSFSLSLSLSLTHSLTLCLCLCPSVSVCSSVPVHTFVCVSHLLVTSSCYTFRP